MLTPAHIPYLIGIRLQFLPRGELCRRRLRPHQHERGQACVRADDLRHLPRGGLEFLSGRFDARAAGSAGRSHGADGHCRSSRPAIARGATTPPTGTAPHAGRPHAESRRTKRAPSATRRRDAGQLRAARRASRCCTPASPAAAPSATAAPRALTFYNNNDNPKAAFGLSPPHIPYLAGTDCSSCHAANYVAGGFGPTNMSAAKHAFVPTTCDTCHEAGVNFYMGASTPSALQGRPADHVSTPNPPSAGDRRLHRLPQHDGLDQPTTLPAGHMPNPGTQACAVCHIGDLSTAAGYNAVRNYGGAAHRHQQRLRAVPRRHGATDASTTTTTIKAAASCRPRTSRPSPDTDCSTCHAPNYATGGFGPMNMTQATHSGVGGTCNTCHEAGLSFYMGAASPGLQGRPADHTAGHQVAPNDCSLCHTTANWNSTALPAGHMPNPGNQACNVCHTSAPTNYKVFAANAVLHTGITSGHCSQCHGAGTQLSVLQQRHDHQGGGARAAAHPVPVRHRLRLLPLPRRLTRRAASAR